MRVRREASAPKSFALEVVQEHERFHPLAQVTRAHQPGDGTLSMATRTQGNAALSAGAARFAGNGRESCSGHDSLLFIVEVAWE